MCAPRDGSNPTPKDEAIDLSPITASQMTKRDVWLVALCILIPLVAGAAAPFLIPAQVSAEATGALLVLFGSLFFAFTSAVWLFDHLWPKKGTPSRDLGMKAATLGISLYVVASSAGWILGA